MHVVEPERSLRQRRLGGMATVLETCLRQTQAETMAPIDLIACLLSDYLTVWGRPATGAPPQASRLSRSRQGRRYFEFSFNPKMNCSLVFDLATSALIAKR